MAWTRAGPLGVYISLQFKNIGSYGKIPSSIPGFYSTALELNDDKCAICYLELREPVHQTTCGHRFCRDCLMRYDFEWANSIRILRSVSPLFHNFRFTLNVFFVNHDSTVLDLLTKIEFIQVQLNCCAESFANNGDDLGLASDEVSEGYQEQKPIHFCSKWDVEPEQ